MHRLILLIATALVLTCQAAKDSPKRSFFDRKVISNAETARVATKNTNAAGRDTLPVIDKTDAYEEEDFLCLKTGRCVLPTDKAAIGEIEPLRVVVGIDSVKLSFDKFGDKVLDANDIDLDSIEYETEDHQVQAVSELDSRITNSAQSNPTGFQVTGGTLSTNQRLLNAHDHQSNLALSERPTRYTYKFPFRLPCWIRYIRIKIWGTWYRFPVMGCLLYTSPSPRD